MHMHGLPWRVHGLLTPFRSLGLQSSKFRVKLDIRRKKMTVTATVTRSSAVRAAGAYLRGRVSSIVCVRVSPVYVKGWS